MNDISSIRKDYCQSKLEEHQIKKDPLAQFSAWWNDALDAQVDDVNAMVLSTVQKTGFPDARVMLLKKFSDKGFFFFTNYQSKKAEQLASNNCASLLFFWKELERQIRILGTTEKASLADNEHYFKSRPFESQISAFVSRQSQIVPNRQYLETQYNATKKIYEGKEETIACPNYWGGYILKPIQFEFWQGRAGRLHDRIQFSLKGEEGVWDIVRLSP